MHMASIRYFRVHRIRLRHSCMMVRLGGRMRSAVYVWVSGSEFHVDVMPKLGSLEQELFAMVVTA